jgi:hypothetical protein
VPSAPINNKSIGFQILSRIGVQGCLGDNQGTLLALLFSILPGANSSIGISSSWVTQIQVAEYEVRAAHRADDAGASGAIVIDNVNLIDRMTGIVLRWPAPSTWCAADIPV